MKPDRLTPPEAHTAYKAGYRRFIWRDAERRRPVWADVWFPSTDPSDEVPISYALGHGTVIPLASVAARGAPFPLVVMSHGAFGSAQSYSWLAEYLARNGMAVLGVSHYGESPLYGAETVDPAAAIRLWDRPGDCTFALNELLTTAEFRQRVDSSRIGAVGHSSGGATVLALGGATLDPMGLAAYCGSEAGRLDRGCQYARDALTSPPAPPEATRSYRDRRVTAIVALDPAAGPGHSAPSLAQVHVPVLVVGSTSNDFLPFEHHAGRYAALLPHASLIRLQTGEGHFVYLNSCTLDLSANGVPLCVDAESVDRDAVHASLAPQVVAFFMAAMPGPRA